ncbi:MAG: hypothetical protein HY765_02675 [Rhodomicrobium sp.]|nr:hypothetical protein [Rhodomicrobium sp.]
MKEQSGQISALPGPAGHVARRALRLIKAAVLLVSIAAAIPTAKDLYYSWANDIPFSEVSHRLAQYALWMKNLECKIDYRALLIASGNKVDVGACPKTGDIAIKITGDRSAHAAGATELKNMSVASSVRLAQAGMEVLCQARQGQKVVRIIKEAGKCFREIVLPLKGTIEKREEVDCNTRC